MREDEAAFKLCVLGVASDTAARQGMCIGSKCMAWRWLYDFEFTNAADNEFKKTGRRIEPDRGYCGLAGHPRA